MIGAAASGKSTVARILARLISRPDGPPAQIISTRDLRIELFGDRGVFGPWAQLEAVMNERIAAALSTGAPVIVDATHARRPWRLVTTQALELPVPVEWIGWWVNTPLELCLQWNQCRSSHQVPDTVIREQWAALANTPFSPSRSEGFAAIVAVELGHVSDLEQHLSDELARLDSRIRRARNSESRFALHGYSRLLDFERLLFLIQLLSRYPELTASDPITGHALEALITPLPSGGLAERAAAYLARLHGPCYGDAAAVDADLNWLQEQGFCSQQPAAGSSDPGPQWCAVEPPPWPAGPTTAGRSGVSGGWASVADRATFCRVMTLLRHILHSPLDHNPLLPVHEHLAQQLAERSGDGELWQKRRVHQDITNVLTPYGFRSANDHRRCGYALGASLLSIPRLVEVLALMRANADHLGDPTGQDICQELSERLLWSGVAIDAITPLRSYFNRALASAATPQQASLLNAQQAERLVAAIQKHQRVVLAPILQGDQRSAVAGQPLRVWPLQLIFHTDAWFLLYETDAVGHASGLLGCRPIEQLALQTIERGSGRSSAEHGRALQRAQLLQELCASLDFGDDPAAQLALCNATAEQRQALLVTVKLHATAAAFSVIRCQIKRFSAGALRLSLPAPGDLWWPSSAAHVLSCDPGTSVLGSSHLYPVEIDLPPWSVARDPELRRWLFSFGGGVRIDAPLALRQEHQQWLKAALAAYPSRRPMKKTVKEKADRQGVEGAIRQRS
jgi:predicted kinase